MSNYHGYFRFICQNILTILKAVFIHGSLQEECGSLDALFNLQLLLCLHTSNISETPIWTHQTSHENISPELPGHSPQNGSINLGNIHFTKTFLLLKFLLALREGRQKTF